MNILSIGGMTVYDKAKLNMVLSGIFILLGFYAYTLFPDSRFIQNTMMFCSGFFFCSFIGSVTRFLGVLAINKMFTNMMKKKIDDFFNGVKNDK